VPVAGWVFLAIFILFVGGGAAFVVASDRKRNPFQVTDAELQAAPTVVIQSAPIEAVDLASAAIQRVGGANLIASEDRSRVAGWIGNTFTNIPSRQEYELVIDICSSPDRHEFRCLARPRFSSSLGGATRARDLAGKLREALAAQGQPPAAH
jgi:hypothetical protein